MRKRIVFIPSYYYLSHPLFFNVVEKISDYEKVYFNTKDPVSWEYNKKRIKKEDILKYFDTYYEVNKEMGYKDSKNNKLQKFYEIKIYIKKIKEILDGIKPVIIIATSDMFFAARVFNQWANINNIPVIIIQHVFLDFKKNSYDLKQRIKYLLFNKVLNIPLCRRQTYYGNEDNNNNYLFLWGEYFKRYYKGKAIYDNIYITGNPACDKYFTVYRKKNYTYYKILNISPDKKIVVFCTQVIDKMFGNKAFTKVISIIKRTVVVNKKYYFIIKVHPREDIEKYKKTFRDLNENNYKIVKNMNLYDLYKITDVQASVSSYSSFEAVASGIPIIIINPNNKLKVFDPFNNEIELRASTSEELNDQLKKCLTEEYKKEFKFRRRKFLKSRLTYLDGKCGERVADKIREIIQKHI